MFITNTTCFFVEGQRYAGFMCNFHVPEDFSTRNIFKLPNALKRSKIMFWDNFGSPQAIFFGRGGLEI